MTSIIYIGMDVHTTNYTLCCYTVDSDDEFAVVNVKPDYHEILKYMERVRSTRGGNCDFICGYEAGCLGYSLYHQLAKHGVACIILAPSTMPQQKGKSIKTDKRDAKNIAKCLAFNLYSPVYVPTAEDDAIKEYIRMRDDVKADLKRTKQQIISFCTRHGFHYEGKSRWTQAYFKWLDSLVFENALYKETLQEYLALYYTLDEKIAVSKAKHAAKKIFEDPACGGVLRIKGFLQDGENWLELNATQHEISLKPIGAGQDVLIIIGEKLNEEKIRYYLE